MRLKPSRPLLLLLLGVALLGCDGANGAAQPTNPPGSAATTAPTYARNPTVDVAVPRLPVQFNPLTPEGSDPITAMVMANVWPQSFVVDDQFAPGTCHAGGPECPSVVSSAEVASVNPLVVDYVLEPGAKWSDGVPITSSDFIYEWQQELALGATLSSSNPALGYRDIESISPPKATTFAVRFSRPFADWNALFSPLVPAHVAEAHGWERAFLVGTPSRTGDATHSREAPTTLVSGGPFEFASETFRGGVPVALTLTRNPHYWGSRAHVARIVFRVEPTQAATLHALVSNTVQLAELSPGAALYSLIATDPNLVASTAPSPDIEQLVFNLHDAVLTSRLRLAIASALDRHQLFTNTFGFTTAQGNVSTNRLFPDGAGGSHANDQLYESADLTEADALFTSAGYRADRLGRLRDTTGGPLVLRLAGPSADPIAEAVEQQLAAQLWQVGIRLVVNNVPEATLLDTVLPQGRYQLALAPYALSPYLSTEAALYTDATGSAPATARAVAATAPAAAAAGAVAGNVGSYSDPKVARLFDEAAGQLNQGAGNSIYNKIDADLWLDMPTLPLFDVPVSLVTRFNLVGVSASPTPAGPLWDAQNWAIQTSPLPTTTTSTVPAN